MIAILHNEPRFSELFVAYLLSRNSRIEEDLIDQLFNSSERTLRVSFFSWRILEKRVPLSSSIRISIRNVGRYDRHDPISCELFMNKFRKLGLISYNGKIEVHSSMLTRSCAKSLG